MMKKYLIPVLLFLFAFTACKSKKQNAISNDEYYTCSMHPQVMETKPGLCPICHMDLIVVKRTSSGADEISLNDEQVRLGNIQYDTIRNGMIGDKTVLTATLNSDETNSNSVSARIMGRIDRLYFKAIGDYVSQGAHLYDLYSEELNNAKQEYLAVLEKQETLDNSIIDFKRLVQSAKTKLVLWGMSEGQIAELARTKKASPHTAFFSTASGYITELPVTEGQFVSEGSVIVKLTGLSTLWAEAQVYASELPGIDMTGQAVVEIPDIPGKQWTGKVSFANPEIAQDSRLNLIRVTIPNEGGLLKPGMPAYVSIKNKDVKALTLPSDAVLRDGMMNIIWLHTGKNMFRMKIVETGMESGGRIEIRSGLQNGDVVVMRGAYLLQSEYVFKKGGNAMSGMEGYHH